MQNLADQINDPVHALERVLESQVELYEQYGLHIQADRELMSRLKVSELEQNNKIKNTLLLKLQAMDQARQSLVKRIAADHKISEEVVTIKDICRVLSGEMSERLLSVRDRLQASIEKLKELQDENTQLASASLSWINGSMATLKRLLTPVGTYNLQGQVDHPSTFAGRNVEKLA